MGLSFPSLKIKNLTLNYKTSHPLGFNEGEIIQLLDEVKRTYPNFDMESFENALTGCTGALEEGSFLTYHIDIFNAVKCGISSRNLNIEEWD